MALVDRLQQAYPGRLDRAYEGGLQRRVQQWRGIIPGNPVYYLSSATGKGCGNLRQFEECVCADPQVRSRVLSLLAGEVKLLAINRGSLGPIDDNTFEGMGAVKGGGRQKSAKNMTVAVEK